MSKHQDELDHLKKGEQLNQEPPHKQEHEGRENTIRDHGAMSDKEGTLPGHGGPRNQFR